MTQSDEIADVLIVGGGVNGVGIARDAAGRGLSVHLVEQGDLGGATSSASTKLFHGGLRYLEQYAFGLVRKALIEREVLLANMPHISKPMRFVLPHMKGMRPAWLLRLGLFIYDHLGGRKLLPGTRVLDLRNDVAGKALKPGFRRAFEYSDGWVDDARLVVLNARDAADRGAVIQTRMRLESAARVDGVWLARLKDMRSGETSEIRARALVNAGGPWVNKVIEGLVDVRPPDPVRLVRGSHIVVRRLFAHERAYFFQLPDERIIFAIPYEEDFTVIGTTDVDHAGDPAEAKCSEEEVAYLCRAASEYFAKPINPEDVVWTYSGVRPLDDVLDGDASKASRDYHIKLGDVDGKAPLISIYGGKITTYRKLAEQAVAELAPYVELSGLPWTAHAPLPGGDFAFDGRADLVKHLSADYPFLVARDARRLVAAYGTDAWKMLRDAKEATDLGQDFGAGLSAREVDWLMTREWAQTAEDVLWRRTKCGLRMGADQVKALEIWMAKR
ncbi:MAG: glycerol-3-phosphate dehydrogenase [Alphaproteobacteria bacterium]|nr:glycerol-3-phosphate dehydrogenase [Alphaproteobacteria bacterium]